MGYILLIVLTLLLINGYILNDRDILSPFVISCGMYFIGSFVAIMNLEKWGIDILPNTVIVIITALIMTGLGEIMVKVILFKDNKIAICNSNNKIIEIPFFLVFLSFVFGIVISYQTYTKLFEMANLAGYKEGKHLLNYVRYAIIHYNASWGTFLPIFKFWVIGIGYVFTFAIINNIIYIKDKNKLFLKYWYYTLPIIPFFILQIFSTGRTGIIQYFSMIIFSGVILFEIKEKWTFKKNLKIIIFGISSLILFYIIFIGIGTFTGKSSLMSIRDTLSIYTGSSIVGLNEYLKDPTYSEYMGEETLYGIRYILNYIGFDVKTFSKHLEFINFSNYSTNIYTSLRRYIHDYGYLGMLVIQFFIGAIYTLVYTWFKKKNKVNVGIIIYSYFGYYLIIQFINATFLTSLFSITQVFEIFFILISYILFIKPYYINLEDNSKNKVIKYYNE